MQVPRAAMERAQESFGRCELGAERRLRRRCRRRVIGGRWKTARRCPLRMGSSKRWGIGVGRPMRGGED